MAKISVIIPIYNTEKYLKQCLDSLKNQTIKDLEFICVDDGSSDSSLSILQEYVNIDSRFILIKQKNEGPGIARNNAIKLANGEFIMFVDSDDWIEPNTCEVLYNYAKDNNANIVQFNYKKFKEAKNKFKDINFTDILNKNYKKDYTDIKSYNYKDFDGFMYKLDLHSWTRIYKADFIKSHNIQFGTANRAEDHVFVNEALLMADKVYFINEYFYNYRDRINSAVNTQSHDNLNIFENIDLFSDFLSKNNLSQALKTDFEEYKLNLLQWHYEQCLEEDLPLYLTKCQNYLSTSSYNKLLTNIKSSKSVIEKIFSIKNRLKNGKKQKILTLIGVEFIINHKKESHEA